MQQRATFASSSSSPPTAVHSRRHDDWSCSSCVWFLTLSSGEVPWDQSCEEDLGISRVLFCESRLNGDHDTLLAREDCTRPCARAWVSC
jgi:hypothetical protein